jgi:hypothetical protein
MIYHSEDHTAIINGPVRVGTQLNNAEWQKRRANVGMFSHGLATTHHASSDGIKFREENSSGSTNNAFLNTDDPFYKMEWLNVQIVRVQQPKSYNSLLQHKDASVQRLNGRTRHRQDGSSRAQWWSRPQESRSRLPSSSRHRVGRLLFT